MAPTCGPRAPLRSANSDVSEEWHRLGLFGRASDTQDEAKDVQEAARSLGVQVVVSAGKADDLDGAFARLEQQGARALFVGADTFFTGQRSQISIHAARHGLPTSWSSRIETEAGGLMSYGGSFLDVYRQVGVLAGKILKGANLADLSVQLPTTFELVINVRTAKTLGVARADEVIE
jgi:putative tryptophan/tyrosine transport system substrate-binding protein